MAGTLLHKLFGWYSSAPVNLTQAEVRGRQPSWQGLDGGGGGSSRSFSDLLKPSDNPIDKQSDMETMMNSDIGRPIIETYAEEASQLDINKQKSIWFECNDSTVEEDLNRMLDRIGVEDAIYSICYQLAGKGNHFRRILWNNEGVVNFVPIDHREIRRIWDPTSKRLLGFSWQGQKPLEPHFENNEHLFSPWSFIHFRNILDPTSEYGGSLIEHLYPMFKRMQYGLNQMCLYRMHVMPNRHVIWMDSGQQDFTTVMEQQHMFESMFRQKSMMSQGGMLESRYDAPAMDSILFIPRREGEKTELETMTGDKDVPDVYDLEYLAKCFYGGARVPKAYLGHGDDGQGLAQASLVSQDIRFARMIRVLRRPIIYGFWQLACIHLALQGKDPKSYNIKVRMSKISALEEEVNAATLESQMAVARDLVSICKDLEVPNREVMELVFKEYLHVPRQFIDVVKLAMSASAAATGNDASSAMFGSMGGGGGGGLDLDLPPEGGEDMDAGDDIAPLEGKVLKNVLTESINTIRKSAIKDPALAEFSVRALGRTVSHLQVLKAVKKSSLVERIEDSVAILASANWPMPAPANLLLTEGSSSAMRLTEKAETLKKYLSESHVETVKTVNESVNMVKRVRASRGRKQGTPTPQKKT